MTIEVGPDPQLPIPLSCNIHSTGQLEVKYGSSSLTHPVTLLHVDIDDLDAATFELGDFGSYSVDATTIDGEDWSDSGSLVTSEALGGAEDPGVIHEVKVTASDGGTPKIATIRLRIREQNISPLP
jgi:hypothetical protein